MRISGEGNTDQMAIAELTGLFIHSFSRSCTAPCKLPEGLHGCIRPLRPNKKREPLSRFPFLFFESAVKFHFPFAAGEAVSAPTATSTAADGGMIHVTAGKNEKDGDHRHHSIDREIHGYLLFMYSREVKNENKIQS